MTIDDIDTRDRQAFVAWLTRESSPEATTARQARIAAVHAKRAEFAKPERDLMADETPRLIRFDNGQRVIVQGCLESRRVTARYHGGSSTCLVQFARAQDWLP